MNTPININNVDSLSPQKGLLFGGKAAGYPSFYTFLEVGITRWNH